MPRSSSPSDRRLCCTLRFRYRSATEATVIGRALAVDDPQLLSIEQDGHTVVCELTAASATSLTQTLNDLLPCARCAEAVMEAAVNSDHCRDRQA